MHNGRFSSGIQMAPAAQRLQRAPSAQRPPRREGTTQAHDSGGSHSVGTRAAGRGPGPILAPPTPLVPARADCPRSTTRFCAPAPARVRPSASAAPSPGLYPTLRPAAVLRCACAARPLRGGAPTPRASCARCPHSGARAWCALSRSRAARCVRCACPCPCVVRGALAVALSVLRARAWRVASARGGARLSPSGCARVPFPPCPLRGA